MAHGYPDYGLGSAISTLAHVVDFGEMAARVRNQTVLDRLGDVVLWEDWSRGPGFKLFHSGGGTADMALHVDPAIGPGYMLRADGGGLVAPICSASQYVTLPVRCRAGVEVEFQLDNLWGTFNVYLGYTLNGVESGCAFRFLVASSEVQVNPGGAGWLSLGVAGSLIGFLQGWHRIKLVLDPVSNMYVRLIVDGRSYPVAVYGAQVVASVTEGMIYCFVFFEGPAVGACVAVGYIGDVTLTVNEP